MSRPKVVLTVSNQTTQKVINLSLEQDDDGDVNLIATSNYGTKAIIFRFCNRPSRASGGISAATIYNNPGQLRDMGFETSPESESFIDVF